MKSKNESLAENGDTLLERLRRAPTSRRSELLTAFLREHIATRLTLELADVEPRAPLMALGMSSLQSMEIKIYLEQVLRCSLPTSLIFDYPTLSALVPQILERIGLAPATGVGGAPRPATSTAPSRDISEANFGDDDVARALARELAELRRQGSL
jgi:acyl carrier protein